MWHRSSGRRRGFRARARRGSVKTAVVIVVASIVAGVLYWSRDARTKRTHHDTRCVVIALDGLDPNLVKTFMDQGLLPNFKKLADAGQFAPLTTSMPPQSPVAWSVFATGTDPGSTGIFDFVHRKPLGDPTSTSDEKPPFGKASMYEVNPGESPRVPLIDYPLDYIPVPTSPHENDILPGDTGDENKYAMGLPLASGEMIGTRKGIPFWKYLEDAGVPVTILRLPANFPPPPGSARQLTGMGTPDIQGEEGISYFWTTREIRGAGGKESHKQIVDLSAGDKFEGKLYGPPNPLLLSNFDAAAQGSAMIAKFDAVLDRARQSIRIRMQDGGTAVLGVGDTSRFLPVQFVMHDMLGMTVDGMIQFRLNAIEPELELYGSAVQFDPASPSAPISNPPDYATELSEAIGRPYWTLGMPEDNKAFGAASTGSMDEQAFREQCRAVLDDNWDTTDYELDRYNGGFLFTYFRTTDVVSHMMWYLMDADHPMHDAKAAVAHGIAIQEAYMWTDKVVGRIREKIGDDTLTILMSDHGFAPFNRKFYLNSWLADHGWLTLYPWINRDDSNLQWAGEVDWKATKAYGLGLNCLYINLQGREATGSVLPAERDAVVDQLCKALEAIVDPETGEHVISKAYKREDIYHGPYVEDAPDIVVGYNRGYRLDGNSGTGEIPEARTIQIDGKEVKTWVGPRKNRWSGDHCCDYVHVPGTIIVNRRLTQSDPGLIDLAPTILQVFGIAKPDQMTGSPVLAPPQKGS
jgi:predicted AlkP superfamily phosphohydrolase/phosphomutase